MNTLAIDIGGTKFTVAVFEGDRMILRESRATDREGGPTWMLGQLVEIVKAWGVPLGRCGIGFGGPVFFDRQRIALSTHVGGWSDFPLVEEISRALSVDTVMDNDANVGALGESQFGAGRGADPLFYMTLSTGIGGGIVSGGGVLRGADSYAGEIGHLTIRPDGPQCLCGARGCFERICCGLWLERDYGLPAKELIADPNFVAGYVEDLALGLKSAIMLLNPARIVIGGGIAKAGDALFVPLRAELRRQITAWSRARIDVVPAALGDDSVLYGALVLARILHKDAQELPQF
jgi:glucokinase